MLAGGERGGAAGLAGIGAGGLEKEEGLGVGGDGGWGRWEFQLLLFFGNKN